MTREIPLTRGYVALIEDDDYNLLAVFNWYAKVCPYTCYAERNGAMVAGQRSKVQMHRFLLGAPSSQEVDHINGNGLDNRRSNLRLCSHSENLQNRRTDRRNKSGYIGVCRTRDPAKWRAQIRFRWKTIHLGTFSNPTEAAQVRDKFATLYFGEFARLNFPRCEEVAE